MNIETTHGNIDDGKLYWNTEHIDNERELTDVIEYWLVMDELCLDPQHDKSVQQANGKWAERVHRSAQVRSKIPVTMDSNVGVVNG